MTREWGSTTADVADAEPGDIVPWTTSYSEKVTQKVTHADGSRNTRTLPRSAGFSNHASIVAYAYDGEVFKCWGQNPRPVTLNEYHPDSCTGDSFIIYRLEASGGGP